MNRPAVWHIAALGMVISTRLTAQITPINKVTPVPQPTIVPIVASKTNLTATPTPIIQKDVPLSQGQLLRVFGRLEFTSGIGTEGQKNCNAASGNGHPDYVDAWIECFDPNGTMVPAAVDIGQNFCGPNQSPGPNYPATGVMVINPLTLIKASVPGMYSCQLLSDAGQPGWAVGQNYQGTDTTWLGLSAPINNPNDAFFWGSSVQTGCVWQGPYTDDEGCLYVGPGTDLAQNENVFDPTIIVPAAAKGLWSPAPGAAFVDVTAAVLVTLCGTTTTCQKFKLAGDTVVVDSYMELDQLDEAGKPFHTSFSPAQRTTIGNLLHHDMLYHKLSTVPVYPSSNQSQFQLKLVVTWISGSTARIDGAQAVAFTSFRGQAQSVPNVAGMTEDAARNALTGSGYSVGLVSPPKPLGKVTAQDPPAGTIELPGSVVNLVFGGVGHGPHK